MHHSRTGAPPRRTLVIAISLCASILGACSASVPSGGAGQASFGDIPTPRSAVMDVGAKGPGVDAGQPFYGYTSDLAPEAALASYTADLIAAGYSVQPKSDGWTPFKRGKSILLVRVGSSGPPTSIVVQLAFPTADGEAPTTPEATSLPSPLTAGPLGEPEPPRGTSVATTPDPGETTGPGKGGQGGGGTGAGGTGGGGAAGGGTGGNGNGGGTGGQGGGNGPPTPGPTKSPKPERTPRPEKTEKPPQAPHAPAASGHGG